MRIIVHVCRPAPRGAGGLKYLRGKKFFDGLRPAPRGAGGLKCHHKPPRDPAHVVPPREGRVD